MTRRGLRLGVNIDHVATLRQARGGTQPSVLAAAAAAARGGATGITVHLREDRRHIQDADVAALRRRIKVALNLEMALAEEIIRFALKVKPDQATIVPEKRRELTTEGGLAVAGREKRVAAAVGAEFIELHTGEYANARTAAARRRELRRLQQAAALAQKLGLRVNAGHGLDYDNVRPVAAISGMEELNIGHSIVARAVLIGLRAAVREMRAAMAAYRV